MKPAVSECKGRVYRAVVNHYINKRGDIIHNNRLNLLKRKSCKGCGDCGWIEEVLKEEVYNTPLELTNLKPGKEYKLQIDYRRGYYDDDCEIEINFKLNR